MGTVIKYTLLSIAGFIFLLGVGMSSEPENPDSPGRAWGACRLFVLDRLRAPNSAEFLLRGETTPLGNGRYEVVDYVNAENGFGGRTQSRFYCDVQYKPETASWTLYDISID